jgi:predicted MFS family arabinose efflux permease
MAIASTTIFATCSIASALAPNLPFYFVSRMLTAFESTSFFVFGSACIGDIYHPNERARALAWFLFGTVVGPAFGPFLGGIIVTYRSWRVLFWLQGALGVLAVVLVVAFLPETAHYRLCQSMEKGKRAKQLWSWMNPMRILTLMRYPNLLAVVCFPYSSFLASVSRFLIQCFGWLRVTNAASRPSCTNSSF